MNYLFNDLKNKLRNTEQGLPDNDCLVVGFSKADVPQRARGIFSISPAFLTTVITKAHLFWYNAAERKFYDQGLAKKAKPSSYSINSSNYNKSKPGVHVLYYIVMDEKTVNNVKSARSENGSWVF